MNTTCPVLTPAEQRHADIQREVEQQLMATVRAALEAAADQAADKCTAAGLDAPPPAFEYFASYVHQQLFLLLCGADPETFEGGDAEIAAFMIRNAQDIRDHYWSGGPAAVSENADA